MLIFDAIIITVVLITLIIASISDMRTREIPDWISYGLIFFVLLTRGLQTVISKNHTYLTYSFVAFITFFAVGSLLYYTRQWGGGDAKLISGLMAAFATSPFNNAQQTFFPYPLVLILNILLVGALYAIIYAAILASKNKKTFIVEFKKLNSEKRMHITKICVLILSVLFAILTFFYFPPDLVISGGVFSLVMLMLPYLLIFVKSVEKTSLYKTIQPSKLAEGDWVREDVYKGKKLIYKKQPFGIDKESIEILKKENIKKVLIKEGIPFVPSFLLGTIITLVLGKVIFFPVI